MANNYDSAVGIITEVFSDMRREKGFFWVQERTERIAAALKEAGLLAEDEVGVTVLHLPAEGIARLDWHTVSVLTQGRGVLLIPTDGADK